MGKNIQNELLSKVQELASLTALTADELAQKQAKIDELQKTIEQLQVENQRLKAGEKNEIAKQPNKEDINRILNKIKSSNRNSAKVILLDTNISKELCLDILNNLNIKSSTRCKKETLVNKILDNIFADNNVSIYNDLIEQLKNVENREQARKILTDSKLKVAELKKLASIMKISLIDKTKDRIIYSIVQRVIGDRLDTEAIMSVKLK